MLILSRKLNESIVIGDCIIVKIASIEHGTVKLGIEAPAAIKVHRQEIHDQIQNGHGPHAPALRRAQAG